MHGCAPLFVSLAHGLETCGSSDLASATQCRWWMRGEGRGEEERGGKMWRPILYKWKGCCHQCDEETPVMCAEEALPPLPFPPLPSPPSLPPLPPLPSPPLPPPSLPPSSPSLPSLPPSTHSPSLSLQRMHTPSLHNSTPPSWGTPQYSTSCQQSTWYQHRVTSPTEGGGIKVLTLKYGHQATPKVCFMAQNHRAL